MRGYGRSAVVVSDIVDMSVDNGVGMPEICGYDTFDLVVFGVDVQLFPR